MLRLLLVLAAVVVFTGLAFAHGGGLDALGGHHNRKLGGYHFHQGSLAGHSFSSKSEALAALKDSDRAFPQQEVAQEPGYDRPQLPNASTDDKLDALARLLVRKGLITEVELTSELRRK
jgi:hypothetical protein